MARKVLAVVLSSVFLWTSIAAAAPAATEPAKRAEQAAAQTAASTGNQPPLPPGRAIRKAQGEEYDDLGPGIIIASWAAAIGVILLVIFTNNGDDDESTPPTTGTN